MLHKILFVSLHLSISQPYCKHIHQRVKSKVCQGFSDSEFYCWTNRVGSTVDKTICIYFHHLYCFLVPIIWRLQRQACPSVSSYRLPDSGDIPASFTFLWEDHSLRDVIPMPSCLDGVLPPGRSEHWKYNTRAISSLRSLHRFLCYYHGGDLLLC